MIDYQILGIIVLILIALVVIETIILLYLIWNKDKTRELSDEEILKLLR